MHTVLRDACNSFLDYRDMEALREFILEEEDKKYNRDRFTFENKLYYIYDSSKSTARIVDAEVGDGITLHKDNKYIDHYSVPLYRAFGAWLETQKKPSEAKQEGDSRMNIPEEALNAAAFAFYGKQFSTDPECWGYEYKRSEARSALEAALPAIEKQIRAQVEQELYDKLPVKLGETAASEYGWLSDLQYVSPKTSAGFEMVELSYIGGSIDLYHITEYAARIAEGESK